MRPIDADALTETIRHFVDTMSVCTSTEYCTGLRFMKKQAIEAVESAPTVDAVPVVHGEWHGGQYDFYCSQCGVYQNYYTGKTNYCPNCGAKMKGANDEAD